MRFIHFNIQMEFSGKDKYFRGKVIYHARQFDFSSFQCQYSFTHSNRCGQSEFISNINHIMPSGRSGAIIIDIIIVLQRTLYDINNK